MGAVASAAAWVWADSTAAGRIEAASAADEPSLEECIADEDMGALEALLATRIEAADSVRRGISDPAARQDPGAASAQAAAIVLAVDTALEPDQRTGIGTHLAVADLRAIDQPGFTTRSRTAGGTRLALEAVSETASAAGVAALVMVASTTAVGVGTVGMDGAGTDTAAGDADGAGDGDSVSVGDGVGLGYGGGPVGAGGCLGLARGGDGDPPGIHIPPDTAGITTTVRPTLRRRLIPTKIKATTAGTAITVNISLTVLRTRRLQILTVTMARRHRLGIRRTTMFTIPDPQPATWPYQCRQFCSI